MERVKEVFGMAKTKVAVVTVTGMSLVSYASAATLNESISPKSC